MRYWRVYSARDKAPVDFELILDLNVEGFRDASRAKNGASETAMSQGLQLQMTQGVRRDTSAWRRRLIRENFTVG